MRVVYTCQFRAEETQVLGFALPCWLPIQARGKAGPKASGSRSINPLWLIELKAAFHPALCLELLLSTTDALLPIWPPGNTYLLTHAMQTPLCFSACPQSARGFVNKFTGQPPLVPFYRWCWDSESAVTYPRRPQQVRGEIKTYIKIAMIPILHFFHLHPKEGYWIISLE